MTDYTKNANCFEVNGNGGVTIGIDLAPKYIRGATRPVLGLGISNTGDVGRYVRFCNNYPPQAVDNRTRTLYQAEFRNIGQDKGGNSIYVLRDPKDGPRGYVVKVSTRVENGRQAKRMEGRMEPLEGYHRPHRMACCDSCAWSPTGEEKWLEDLYYFPDETFGFQFVNQNGKIYGVVVQDGKVVCAPKRAKAKKAKPKNKPAKKTMKPARPSKPAATNLQGLEIPVGTEGANPIMAEAFSRAVDKAVQA